MLNVAIIGLGTIAPIHKNAIEYSTKAKLVAVCDIDKNKQNDYSQIAFYTDIDEMLKNEKLDCVHICLPHYLHVPVIEKCAKAGVNVFTEKPLGMNYSDCEKVFSLEKDYGVKIGVCLQNRYNATSVKMREIMQSAEFGEFLGARGIVTWNRPKAYYDEAPWRGIKQLAGGGSMINQSIHTLDLLAYIGGNIESIDAKIANLFLKSIEVEDSVMANLRYVNGANAMFFATNGYAQNAGVLLEFAFEKAIFTIDENKLYKKQNGEIELLNENIKLEGTKQYYGASHSMAIEAFYDALIQNTADYISVQEGAYSIKLIDSILKASEQNNTVLVK